MKRYQGSKGPLEAWPANGITGVLLDAWGDAAVCFRVYKENHKFDDYRMVHPDPTVTINDTSCWFYKTEDGKLYFDLDPESLALKEISDDGGIAREDRV